ncbi:MAG: response regulator transcription factor [Bacteroidia bacterium]
MKKLIIYGLLLGALISLLKIAEYKFVVRDHTVEIYIGIIAMLFTVLGVWTGLKLVKPKVKIVKEVEVKEVIIKEIEIKEIMIRNKDAFELDQKLLKELAISKREYEVLELIAGGLSNQEIADKLFVSLNTIKTHSSNLFEKLGVERRTQAVQKAKELSLIA